MSDVCDISLHRKKENEAKEIINYSDEEAELHAGEVGVSPRPMETKNEIENKFSWTSLQYMHSDGLSNSERKFFVCFSVRTRRSAGSSVYGVAE